MPAASESATEPADEPLRTSEEDAANELTSLEFAAWARSQKWNAEEIVPGRIAVSFAAGVSRAEREQVAARISGRLGRDRTHRDGTSSSTILLPPAMGIRAAITTCRALRGVVAAEPVVRMERMTDDPYYPELWSLHNTGQVINGTTGTPDADVDAPEAWGIQTGSSSVIIAVIDSGVDFNHPDLAPNTWFNAGEMGGGKDTNSADDDGNGYIDDWRGWDFEAGDNDPSAELADPDFGHGTDVAAVAAGVADNQVAGVGIAYGCSVMHLRAGDTTAVADAVRYATDNGARVINISQGHDSFIAAEQDAIQYARDHGVLVCCSAGNSAADNDATPKYPASYPLDNIIAVAASDKHDGLWYDGPGSGSNYGATSVDLAAPGAEISSAEPGRTLLFESDLAPETLFADNFDDNDLGSDWTLGQDPGDDNYWDAFNDEAWSWGYEGPYPADSRTWIESRAFVTTGRAGVGLTYYYYVEAEANDDFLSVEVWDGAAWHEVARHASAVSGVDEQGYHSVSLVPYRGADTKLRFIWNSDSDDNDYYGALVDDVQVLALGTDWVSGASSGTDGWIAVSYSPTLAGAGSYGDGQYPYSANAHTWVENTTSFNAAGAHDIAVYHSYAVDAEFDGGTAHDYLAVEVWDGAAWQEIARYSGADPAMSVYTALGDASAHANGAMQVRFLWHSDNDNNNYGGGEAFHVEISRAGGTNYDTLKSQEFGSFGSGTSDASPLVAGVAALVWSQFPSLTWQEVRDRILDNVDKKPALSGTCVTGGRLNAYRALEQHTVRFELATSTVDEGTTPAQVWVELSPASSETVTVDYAVTGGSANGGGDDYTLDPGTITFAPGETRQPIDVAIVDDGTPEGDENIVIGLSNPQRARLGSPASHDLTILGDTAPAPPVSLVVDMTPKVGNALNVNGPASRSLGIISLDGGTNPPSTRYAIQTGSDPASGWLRFVASGGRTDVLNDGTAPEWHTAAEWAGLRLRGLAPGTQYTFMGRAKSLADVESAHVEVGNYGTNADCDVDDSGGPWEVRGSDFALLRHALRTGTTIGVDQAWSCDVNDDGAADWGDMTLLLDRLMHPQ